MLSDINEPINLGNPEELSVLEFAELILKIRDNRSKIEYKPLPQDDPKVRRPDITKARDLLGWSPKIRLEDGLKETIRWFEN